VCCVPKSRTGGSVSSRNGPEHPLWELATVTWHVDQRNAVAMTEVHGGAQLPGGQAVVVVFTLVEIALVNEADEENEVFGVPDIPPQSMQSA
jgi:hypothetical protein